MSRYSADGLRIATTVFEAAAWHYCVKVSCRCGHIALFNPHGLWWLLDRRGMSDRFADLRQRFYCTRCQTLQRRRVRPTSIETEEGQATINLPLPEARVWKSALSRFRC